ncbi:hypothetical protein P3T23_007417 [Paraburkholderia sp. GAS448]
MGYNPDPKCGHALGERRTEREAVQIGRVQMVGAQGGSQGNRAQVARRMPIG